ncbi:Gfo/Idh/MocA family protein [Arenivirga flava]|uniref:Gfo/Idh/MocA-like oxidoreductase N-terminal domain-containing protein n=1 Tax=Arenivirga flava TaxID=1930060 RepID=A0AA37UIV8_9MICO|nr:Gfo/Idh/MocA family oxidoreductase [Arenivirga flava]GMA28526.1 hypothetical protein GCM10025874_17790 [Arenivirga flava]
MSAPYRFAVVGTGWRTGFFHAVARALPERLQLAGVVARSDGSAERAAVEHDAPVHRSVAELLRGERPDFVIVSVPREAAPGVIAELVAADVPVLSETPPAADLEGLRALWREVGPSGLVQVAEQYPRYPGHAARKAIVDAGLIGRPTSVHVSSTHDYHAFALMRGLLGAGFAPVTVRADAFDAPLVDPLVRDAWTDDDTERPATTQLATLDFGGGRSGLYDFTSNQWHNQLRHRRILVRGSRGEIADDAVIRLAGPRTILESTIMRRQLGYDLDLDGYATEHLSLDGEVLWRNAFPGTRLSDEELALADLLLATGAWAQGGGDAPYPLAEASQDHAITLAMRRALEGGGRETVAEEAWAG